MTIATRPVNGTLLWATCFFVGLITIAAGFGVWPRDQGYGGRAKFTFLVLLSMGHAACRLELNPCTPSANLWVSGFFLKTLSQHPQTRGLGFWVRVYGLEFKVSGVGFRFAPQILES